MQANGSAPTQIPVNASYLLWFWYRDLSILHSVMEWAVVQEHVERNPVSGIKHPTIKQRKGVVLTPEQFGLLKRSFDDEQDRVLFLTFVLTAVRRSEGLSLRWRDVSLTEDGYGWRTARRKQAFAQSLSHRPSRVN